ncbi:hypothetical protein C8Q75DRAFT_778603 [Abortiporus biennis]|nr:hypothetical protein C8Q75DRAFT_778603 [Abortiporus biennis]
MVKRTKHHITTALSRIHRFNVVRRWPTHNWKAEGGIKCERLTAVTKNIFLLLKLFTVFDSTNFRCPLNNTSKPSSMFNVSSPLPRRFDFRFQRAWEKISNNLVSELRGNNDILVNLKLDAEFTRPLGMDDQNKFNESTDIYLNDLERLHQVVGEVLPARRDSLDAFMIKWDAVFWLDMESRSRMPNKETQLRLREVRSAKAFEICNNGLQALYKERLYARKVLEEKRLREEEERRLKEEVEWKLKEEEARKLREEEGRRKENERKRKEEAEARLPEEKEAKWREEEERRLKEKEERKLKEGKARSLERGSVLREGKERKQKEEKVAVEKVMVKPSKRNVRVRRNKVAHEQSSPVQCKVY